MDHEDLLERIGSFGVYQKRFCLIIFLSIVPIAFPLLMFAFTQYPSEFYCAPSSMENYTQNSGHEQLSNQSFAERHIKRRQCKMPIGNESYISGRSESDTILVPCTNGWIFEDDNTVISEFHLVCDDAWKVPLAGSMFMIGLCCAQFCAKLADRFGRRPVFLFFSFMQFTMVGMIGCSWNYLSYVVFVFFAGLSGMVNYVTGFVLATEMMGIKRKTEIGTMCSLGFSTGYIISPLLGYLFPYWRWYLWATALVGVLYIPLIWMIPESVRWLIVSGRMKEAKKLAKTIASVNGKNVDIEDLFQNLSHKKEDTRICHENFDLTKESSFYFMLKNRTMLIRSSVMYLTWFLVSMTYFGISLNPSQLSGNRLTNIFMSGLIEFPAATVGYLAIRWFGRIRPCVLFLMISGISCSIAPFLRNASHHALTNALLLLGKSTTGAAFVMAYVTLVEITPTLVRSTSMGVASASARLGGVVSPFLFFAGNGEGANDQFIPMLVMGVMMLFGGYLYLFFIPETKGLPAADSIQEAVDNKRVYGLRLCRKFSSKLAYTDEVVVLSDHRHIKA